MICPNCGFPHSESAFGDELAGLVLRKLQHRILARLIAARGALVGTELLINACYHDRDDGGPVTAEGCLHNTIHYLRKRLTGAPYRIDRFYGEGYRLVRIGGDA